MLSAGGGLTRGGHGDGGRSQAVGRSHQDLPSNASHTRSNHVAGSQLFPGPSLNLDPCKVALLQSSDYCLKIL